MDTTQARHARETLAVIGKTTGVSRESVRKAKVVRETFSDGEKLVMSGACSVNKLYQLAKQDRTVGLYVKVSPELKEAAKDEAMRRGMTLAAFVIMALSTQICGEG